VSNVKDVRAIVSLYRDQDIPKTFGENMARYHHQQLQSTATQNTGGWTGVVKQGLLTMVGLGNLTAPPPVVDELDMVKSQLKQQEEFARQMEVYKAQASEELKHMEQMHKDMMERIKSVF
jgi:hypothetical protein